MKVRWNKMTGHPTQVDEALRRSVSAYTRQVRGFKIGRTNDPHARASRPDYRDVYDELIVIYESTSITNADGVERDLVDFFEKQADNVRAGGGGPDGDAPHFVYVVVER